MSIKLPDIDLEAITDVQEAKWQNCGKHYSMSTNGDKSGGKSFYIPPFFLFVLINYE